VPKFLIYSVKITIMVDNQAKSIGEWLFWSGKRWADPLSSNIVLLVWTT